jgi:hypothetical protein
VVSDVVESLRANFSRAFALPPACVDWLIDLWEVTQTFDDYADGDPVDRAALDSLIWRTLVAMPSNQWFAQNAGAVLPVIGTAILKWQAADKAERDGAADARSFVWRAAYYDVVLLAITLTHGHEAAKRVAHLVMHLYGETLEDYLSEFKGGRDA